MSQVLWSRREAMGTAVTSVAAGLALLADPDFVFAAQGDDEELVPFVKEPRSKPDSLDWETLDEWITPQDQTFSVQYYGIPKFETKGYALEIMGLVDKPKTLSIDELK